MKVATSNCFYRVKASDKKALRSVCANSHDHPNYSHEKKTERSKIVPFCLQDLLAVGAVYPCAHSDDDVKKSTFHFPK